MSQKAIHKIIKNLKSSDDNDKLASLSYIIKLFPSPEQLIKSDSANEIWSALRSTQFLERALKMREAHQLVIAILSVFLDIGKSIDFIPFIKPLSLILQEENVQDLLIRICNKIDDISIIFDFIDINLDNLEFLSRCTMHAKTCQMTSSIIKARPIIFELLTNDNDLNNRKNLFILISNLVKATKFQFAIFKRPPQIEFASFLAAERLAMVELRLQLDTPLNYKEIEELERLEREKEGKELPKKKKDQHEDDYVIDEEDFDDYGVEINEDDTTKQTQNEEETSKQNSKVEPMPGMKFTKQIGPLLNSDLTASACQLLELLVKPLVEYEDSFSDDEINTYFNSINSLISDSCEIFKAADGERDKTRNELKCLLSIVALWLRDGSFLCANKTLIKTLPNLFKLLVYFPEEALQFLPAFTFWSDEFIKNLKVSGFIDLSKELLPISKNEDKTAIESILKKINKL